MKVVLGDISCMTEELADIMGNFGQREATNRNFELFGQARRLNWLHDLLKEYIYNWVNEWAAENNFPKLNVFLADNLKRTEYVSFNISIVD
jgi:hypothetical protein